MSDYDPVQCLREEVSRFKRTNTFTAMEVTGFYVQAAVVLDELERAKAEVERASKSSVHYRNEANTLTRQLNELDDENYTLVAALTDCVCSMGFANPETEPGKGIWASRARAQKAIGL